MQSFNCVIHLRDSLWVIWWVWKARIPRACLELKSHTKHLFTLLGCHSPTLHCFLFRVYSSRKTLSIFSKFTMNFGKFIHPMSLRSIWMNFALQPGHISVTCLFFYFVAYPMPNEAPLFSQRELSCWNSTFFYFIRSESTRSMDWSMSALKKAVALSIVTEIGSSSYIY